MRKSGSASDPGVHGCENPGVHDPEKSQISGWLAKQYAHRDDMQVSHETIYRSLFIQTRGVLKKVLAGL
jgi:hypothetical protein